MVLKLRDDMCVGDEGGMWVCGWYVVVDVGLCVMGMS